VRWLPITHSTPDTCALHIRCAAGSVLHTADWKIDAAPQSSARL
jgi:ribonuclease J